MLLEALCPVQLGYDMAAVTYSRPCQVPCRNCLIQSWAGTTDVSPTLRARGCFRRCRIGASANAAAFPFSGHRGSAAAFCGRSKFLVWRARPCGIDGPPVVNGFRLLLRAPDL